MIDNDFFFALKKRKKEGRFNHKADFTVCMFWDLYVCFARDRINAVYKSNYVPILVHIFHCVHCRRMNIWLP